MPLISRWKRAPLIWQLGVLISFLILIVGGLVIGLLATVAAAKANNHIASECAFYKDIATVKLTPETTPVGFQLVADARKAYIGTGCRGALPAPDPRIVPYLTSRAN